MFLSETRRALVRIFSLRPRDHGSIPIKFVSRLIDVDYYNSQKSGHPLKSERAVLRHYQSEGFKQFLNPHRLFDERWYQDHNDDVRKAKIPGLFHYLQFGFGEGRSPHPLISEERYRRLYQDVVKARVPALVHYLEFGFGEGRSPHPLFDEGWYRETSGVDVGVPCLLHYVEVGWREGRSPHPAISDDFLKFLLKSS